MARVIAVSLYILCVRLRRQVTHATASRWESRNLVVASRLSDGSQGWGEALPRPYLTGETPAGSIAQMRATPLGDQLARECGDWGEVIELCAGFRPPLAANDSRGHSANALRCAVELSLLDAFGHCFGEPVSRVVPHFAPARELFAPREEVRYSGAITAGSPRQERWGAIATRLYGFNQCKVKVGVAGADDVQRLHRIRFWMGSEVDLRIDANGGWSMADLDSKLLPLLRFGISSIEQPVTDPELAALASARAAIPVPIMLDESLTSLVDAQRAIDLGVCDLFNIRLSKCGGFIESLRLAAMARAAGLGYQLGCHPGETGILSAAGRHWATAVGNIRYLEGSYDRFLLRELLTSEDLSFGYGGRAPALPGPGLGVSIKPAALARATIDEFHWRAD